MNAHLLIVDDDVALNQMLRLHFEDQGYLVSSAGSAREGLEQFRRQAPDLVILDQQMPDAKGIDILPELVADDPDLPVIMMTGVHDLELAIEAIKGGARDFVHKPIKTGELEHVVRKELEHRRLAQQVAALKSIPSSGASTGKLIGRSEQMLRISKEIALTAASDANILIFGESGTGKEVVARAIHQYSNRPGPFVAINSAAIVDNLLESELFGHEKGAFTGAVERKIGKFELAQDGTLFLDEIGELALPLQAKLLRVLQEQTFERVGGSQSLSTNARIIAATNRDLEQRVAAGAFREDLLYRLNVIHMRLPPLRERPEDIPLLVESLLERQSQTLHKPALTVTDQAMLQLCRYAWPGNVRELENTLLQCMVRSRDGVLTPEMLSLSDGTRRGADPVPSADPAPNRTLDQVEADYIQRVLDHTGGHKGNSCTILGISRPALDRKIERYALVVNKLR